MADYNTELRGRIRHKLRTRRGRSPEAYMRENHMLMREMVRLQTELQRDVYFIANAVGVPIPLIPLAPRRWFERLFGAAGVKGDGNG